MKPDPEEILLEAMNRAIEATKEMPSALDEGAPAAWRLHERRTQIAREMLTMAGFVEQPDGTWMEAQ